MFSYWEVQFLEQTYFEHAEQTISPHQPYQDSSFSSRQSSAPTPHVHG